MKFKSTLPVILSCAAIVIVFATTPVNAQQSYIPLEPIPGSNTSGNFGDYVTAIYRFALWSVGIAAMFMITIGGGMYLTSAGNTSALGNAKNVINDAIIGLVLALTAWFLLNLINPDIINGDLSSFNNASGSSSASSPTDASSPANTYTASEQASAASLAQTLLNQARFNSSPDCSSAAGKVSPQSNLNEVIQGKSITTCHSGCKSGSLCKGSATLNINLLREITTVSGNVTIGVNSIGGGSHESDSKHYSGNAMDIAMPNSALLSYLKGHASSTYQKKGRPVYVVNGIHWWYEADNHFHVQTTSL
ncbi:MAG: hypothetical protein HGB34_00365 [Candidatus Moranbacteria bacterium]|nr:hypothetical protein [Candidatus Moranbacteria bacterium]